MRGYFKYLRGRYATAGRESWAEVRGHIPVTLGATAVIALLGWVGAIKDGVGPAIIAAIGGPVLTGTALYAWKLLSAPYKTHKQLEAAQEEIARLRMPPEETLVITMPEPTDSYVRFSSRGPGRTQLVMAFDWFVITNTGEPILIQDIGICVLRDDSDDELPSKRHQHSFDARKSPRLESQDADEFLVHDWIVVDEDIPVDQRAERTRLRVATTRLGVKYYKLEEALLRWSD